MICRNCGRENRTNNGFCAFCGYNFSDFASSDAMMEDDVSEIRQKIVISVLLFVLIIILSMILFVVIRIGSNRNDDDDTYYEEETEDVQVAGQGGLFDKIFGSDKPDEEKPEADSQSDDAAAQNVNMIPTAEYCAAYKKYIDDNSMNFVEAGFIDVNGDEVYELVLVGDCEASGNRILTYSRNGVDVLQTNRLYFNYIPGENLLCNSDGNSGYYYDLIYAIEDGKWTGIATGNYGEKYGENGIELDAFDNPVIEYVWNDQTVDVNTYYSKLDALYDRQKSTRAIFEMDISKIINELNSATPVLSNGYQVHYKEDTAIHTYEVVVSDVSWCEAYRACNDKGGHLVHINSKEEFDYIVELLYSQGLQDKKIWLGGRRSYVDEMYHWAAPYYNDDRYYEDCTDSIVDNPIYRDFWLQGEPSYYSDDGQGNYFDERYMQMFYSNKQERFVWNDTVDDVLSVIASYRGQIAYICEYE